jgi:hypothetical protein
VADIRFRVDGIVFHSIYADEDFLPADVFSHYDAENWAALPDDFKFPGRPVDTWTTSCCLVWGSGVCWQGYPKYTSTRLTTAALSWADIMALKEGSRL